MRDKDDCTYFEYKDAATSAFHLLEHDHWSAEQVTNYLTEEDWYDGALPETSAFLWYLSIAVREIELGVIERRVLCEISWHIPLYDQGDYHDLSKEEQKQVDADVAYVKANVKLIPKEQLEKV